MDDDASPKGCIGWMVVGRRGMCCWLKSRPCRWSFHSSNPMCHGSLGSRVSTPCRRRHSCEEPWYSNGCPLCGTSIEDSFNLHRLLCNSRGLVRGHTTRCPCLDTCSFRYLSTARPPAGKGPEKQHRPSALPTRVPLDPVRSVLGDHQSANAPSPKRERENAGSSLTRVSGWCGFR